MNYKAVGIVLLAVSAIGYCTHRQYKKYQAENTLSEKQRQDLQGMLDGVPEIVKPSR